MQFLWRYIDELIGKNLEFQVILEFLLYTSATLVPMALPLSILMSSLMTFGNLGEKYELTAIKASGISLQKIMRPLVVVVFFLSIGTFFFANNVLPYANLQMRSLLYDIRQQRPELQLKPGQFNNLIDGYSIRINSKDPKTNTMHNIQIYDHTEGQGNVSVVFADSATMRMTSDEQSLLMTLYNGHSYNELQDMKIPVQKRTYPHRYDRFEKQEILMSLTGFNFERTDQDLFKNHYAMMNIAQLEVMSDSIENEISNKENNVYNSLIKTNLFKKNEKPVKKSNIRIDKKSDDETQITKEEIYDIDPYIDTCASTESRTNKINTDTTQNSTASLIDCDSLFSRLTLNERSKVASSALSYARTSKNLIVNSLQVLESKTGTLRKHEIEWHRKFVIAFACLVFLFIGAPLGAIIRKGGLGLPLVLSVLFFILYYILSLTGEKLVRESVVLAYQGMWGTTFIFAITGGFLTYQATTDSSMLNMDTYLNFLKKYFGQRYNVVDKLSINAHVDTSTKAKIHNIKNSLITLQDNVKSLLEWGTSRTLTDISVSVFTFDSDANAIEFERYYNNTFRIIINHPVFHDKNIRSKVYQFPSFTREDYDEKRWKATLKLILACIPPITLIVIIRQWLKYTFLNMKLKKISQLIPELLSLLNISFPED